MNADFLILNNLNLARIIALKYYKKGMNKTRCTFDDLEQEGRIGLIKAARKFNSSKGVKFNTFATKFIQGSIITFLYSTHLVSISTQKQKDSQFKFPLVREFDYYEENLFINNFDIDEIAEQNIQKEKVLKVSMQLKSIRKREIVNLIFKGYRQAEIAKLFYVTESRIGQEMMAIRKQIKECLV